MNAENPSSVWGFATMDLCWGFAGYRTEIEAYRDRGDDRVCGYVKEWVRADVAYLQGKQMAADAVKEERERIAVLLDAMVKDAEEASERDSRRSYDRNGVDAGYADRLEELAKSLRGES